MKRTLIIAAALSAAAALAACDKGNETASAPGASSTDNSVTMPSPAPENTAPSTGSMGSGSGTMGGSSGSSSTTTQ